MLFSSFPLFALFPFALGQWVCPMGSWNGSLYVDSTPTQAKVYGPDGQLTTETEDRHNFTRDSACGVIVFNIIECTCQKNGAPSMKCPQAIVSNFSAKVKGNESCADAVTKIWYEHAESKGSYMATRKATYNRYAAASAAAKEAAGEKPLFCQQVCKDTNWRPCKSSDCYSSNKWTRDRCQKTCSTCARLCEPTRGDWARRQIDTETWATKPGHSDALDPGTVEGRRNRKWLEDELEIQAQKVDIVEQLGDKLHKDGGGYSHYTYIQTSKGRYKYQTSELGRVATFGRAIPIKLFDRRNTPGARHNCCPDACGYEEETSRYGTFPIMWDQDAVTPFSVSEYENSAFPTDDKYGSYAAGLGLPCLWVHIKSKHLTQKFI
jgi:hypothetical protein